MQDFNSLLYYVSADSHSDFRLPDKTNCPDIIGALKGIRESNYITLQPLMYKPLTEHSEKCFIHQKTNEFYMMSRENAEKQLNNK